MSGLLLRELSWDEISVTQKPDRRICFRGLRSHEVEDEQNIQAIGIGSHRKK